MFPTRKKYHCKDFQRFVTYELLSECSVSKNSFIMKAEVLTCTIT